MNNIESCNIVSYVSFTHISHVKIKCKHVCFIHIFYLYVCKYVYISICVCSFKFGYHLSRCIKLSRIDVEDESSTFQVLSGVLMIFVSVRTGIHQFFYKALCLEGVGIGVMRWFQLCLFFPYLGK